MEAGTHISLGGKIIYVSPVAWLMTAIGLAYVAEILLQGGFTGEGGGLMGLGAVHPFTAWALGAVGPRAIFEQGEWWRLVSGVFLHGSAVHLLFNAWALYQLGWIAVRIFGPARFLLAYLATGYAGAIASALWLARDGGGQSLGASGAVCGLLGLLFADLRRRPDPQSIMIARQLGMWAIIILLMGLFSTMGDGVRIDNAGHVGGFAAGYALASVLSSRFSAELRGGRLFGWVHGVLAVLLLATVVGLGFAAVGARERESWISSVYDFLARVEGAQQRLRRPGATTADIRRSIAQAELPPELRDYETQVKELLDLADTDVKRRTAGRALGLLKRRLLETEAAVRAPDLFIRSR